MADAAHGRAASVTRSAPTGAITETPRGPEAVSSDGRREPGPPDARAHLRALGPFLCWAVVFADIGTSVYYTPGILFGTNGIGTHAAFFVLLTMAVFVLLCVKYAEVTVRYPEGGGVVTVGTRAVHPFFGLLGGMFILVDYFLTAALSADSGIGYLGYVVRPLDNNNVAIGIAAIAALVLLGLLNWIGIAESAKVSATFATIAFLSQAAVVAAVIAHVGTAHVLSTFPRMLAGPRLRPLQVLTGYAGAFLAFSGLESISQLSPVMRNPRGRVAPLAMGAVVATIGLTSPWLTLWSTTLLAPRTILQNAGSNDLLSLLADKVTGPWLGVEVAISGAILLIFACNTALIGTYHVFLALSRMRFFPEILERRNRLRGTPHFAILLAVGIPVLILIPASAAPDTQTMLGDLYAFGLLGAFSVTCLSLDLVRWREQRHQARVAGGVSPLRCLLFIVGVLTTLLVVLAWSTNLRFKPAATEFGGTVTMLGLVVAGINYARLTRRGLAVAFPSDVRVALPGAVMVLLPTSLERYDELIQSAAATADGRPVVFVYRGSAILPRRRPGIFEVVDPYLYDRAAKDALGRAERLARHYRLDRRYVYVPAEEAVDGVTRVWQTVQPRDTLATIGDEGTLHAIAPDRIRRPAGQAQPIVHYLKRW